MEVKVLSRQMMCDFKYHHPYIVISICEPGEPVPKMQLDLNREHVHPIIIHDVDDIEFAKKNNYKILDKDQAREVLEVVERYKDKVKTIIVHCGAGICRSAGLGAALLLIYNGDDSEIMQSPRYKPNRHVFRMVLEEALNMGLVNVEKHIEQRKITK